MTTLILVTGEQDGGIRQTYERTIKDLGLRARVVYVRRTQPTLELREDHFVLLDIKYVSHWLSDRLRKRAKVTGATLFEARINQSSLRATILNHPVLATRCA